MKLSLNWIKQYVDLPKELTIEKLAYDLTMCTVEVEETVNLAESFNGLVVGRVLTVEEHPNADKLHICTVDVGDMSPSTIVCGGVNLKQGMLTVVSKPGAMVRWHGEGEPVEIKPAKLRGVMSYGMICASDEVGLGELFPASQEAEIMDLSDFDVTPGQPLADALGFNDYIIDIDNKSMTNRPDLWGHYGMARELAAIYGCNLKPIERTDLPSKTGDLKVIIEDANLCPRYAGLVINNVKNIQSPFELRSLIWRVGMRPINLPVDITNYVMLACGQPTHGFDRQHIHGAIHVRTALNTEKLELLDGNVLDLTPHDLVIADEDGPVALAGVMGGKLDSILPETKDLILEVANFDALNIRRTSQRFDVRTEASSRYEKGIDPQRIDDALSVAIQMFKKYFADAKFVDYVDNYPVPFKNANVTVDLAWLRRRLGKELSAKQIESTLALLGFKTKVENNELLVEAPSWRSTGDISLPDDILEEIARLMGYENFDFIPPNITLNKAINQRQNDVERAVREYLAFRCGMQEIFTYPWIDDVYIEAAGIDMSGDMLSLSTPPAPEESHLRSSLIPGMLMAINTNLRYFDNFKIYELTQVFYDRNYHSINSDEEKLPEMPRHLAGAVVGNDPIKLFREVKGALEFMHRIVQIEALTFRQVAKPTWSEDKLWTNVLSGDDVIGYIGLLSQKSARVAGIKRSLAVLFELDEEKLIPLASRENKFEHLPQYPLVDFDLSIIFDENVKWEDVRQVAEKVDMVKDVSFIDEYIGSQVGEGKKSVTLRAWIGSDKGTLTSEQINTVTNQMIKKMNKKFGGEVRGA
jgi:phenylalanyl-tRNA synthetase beta chain